ncbi:Zinc metalloproteinase [Trichostrongylus colubriformis]|uniref:Zinc metalloproteinase n=1 Tax=Trichostrongylus colubriformis TaxID=6319 RepID=A0AAN8FMS9_TRICO
MRAILLILLLFVAAGGLSEGSFLSRVVSGAKNVGAKIKNATIVRYEKLTNSTTFLNVRSKLKNMKNKIVMTFKQTPQRLKALMEKLKNIKAWFFDRNKINPKGDTIDQVNNNSGITDDMYQGDMILTEEQIDEIDHDTDEQLAKMNSSSPSMPRRKRQALVDERYPATLWSEGVNYYFHPSASIKVRNVFTKAAKLWEKDTCIKFVQNQRADARIMVAGGAGCSSNVGRIGREQKISLGGGCETVGIASHEIGHSLGLFHTHSRTDRDDYIDVFTDLVTINFINDFNKETPDRTDNYHVKYDYGSIMHYGGTVGAKFIAKGRPTIVPKDEMYQSTLGSPFISFTDLSIINEHYHCKEKCDPVKSAKCQMGGFPHPQDCQRCVCPGGYGGNLCNERPSGCGRTIQASPAWSKFEDVIGRGGDQVEDFDVCNYWIESPKGTEIEVRLIDYELGVSIDGCVYAGVEIKTNKDQTLTGYRFCSPKAAGTTLRSYSNRVPIITYNRFDTSKTVLEYRHVPATSDRSKPSPDVTTDSAAGVMRGRLQLSFAQGSRVLR